MDLTPLVQVAAALLMAAATAATPYIAPLLRRYLHLQLTATQAAMIQTAADVGAQAAYGFIAKDGKSYRVPAIRNAAIQYGVSHVLSSVPDALADIGVTPAHVSRMVEARFGGLLAADPTVSIEPEANVLAPAREA